MDSIRKLRIKHEDGTYSNSIPIGASSDDIFMTSGGTLTDSMYDVEEAIIALDKTNDAQTESINELVKSISSNTTAIQSQKDVNEKQEIKMENFEKALAQEKVYVFDNVYAMKNANNLKAGMYCITKGYYTPNDGGKGEYLIRTKTDNDVDDGGSIHKLLKDLVAELIIKDNTINIRQLGGKSQDEKGKYDAKEYLYKYINILESNQKNNRRLKLYIPSGIWYFSPTDLYRKGGFYIYGDETFTGKNIEVLGTIITSLNENQSYIWNVGDDENLQQNIVIKNLFFSSSNFVVRSDKKIIFDNIKEISDTVLRIKRTQYLITDNLFFGQIKGQALGITTSWELYFNLLNFRGVNSKRGILNFEPLIGEGNITACNFNKIMFEGFLHNLINISEGCALAHCDFNTINIEDFALGGEDVTCELVTENTIDFSSVNKSAIINLEEGAYARCIVFNNILLNNMAHYIKTYQGEKYIFDVCVHCRYHNDIDLLINNISCIGINKDCDLIYTENVHDGMVYPGAIIAINNCINTNDRYRILFNLIGGFNGRIFSDSLNLEKNGVGAWNIKSWNFNFLDPFYKIARTAYLSRPLIYSDKEAQNHTKLIVKPLLKTEGSDLVFAKIPFYTKTLKIRAKIPNEKIAIINYKIDSNSSISVSLTGTGEYKWYTLFADNTTGNDNSTINISSVNLTEDIFIDCVKYI